MRLAAIFAITASLFTTPAYAEDSDHVSELGEVRLLHGWAREPEGHGDTLQVYFELEHNGATPATLTGAASEIATSAQVMAASLKAGETPVVLGTFPLTPGEHFDLGPETVFIQLGGITDHLHEGDEIEMTVAIEPFGEVELHVEILDHDADNHAHAGHNH
ncbi:MAG: copper chaperone PCu(A)C [Cognatishimia sp.]|uniref:copper chaperone PCu(A)C n=1 Tax=Cognatishimia sp. TaxID=2211648 RepID=UPI003B8C8B68